MEVVVILMKNNYQDNQLVLQSVIKNFKKSFKTPKKRLHLHSRKR